MSTGNVVALSVCAIVVMAAVVIGVFGRDQQPSGSASLPETTTAAGELSFCALTLSTWEFSINYWLEENVKFDAPMFTFGSTTPIALWLSSELQTYAPDVYEHGQASASKGLHLAALSECENLQSDGLDISSIPLPPASPNDPAPAFDPRYVTTTTSPSTSSTTTSTTTTTTPTTSCDAAPLPTRGSRWPDNAPAASLDPVHAYVSRNDESIPDVKVTGTLDPCNATWVDFSVFAPSVGGAYGFTHLSGGAWRLVWGPGTGSAAGAVPANVLRDFG